MTLKLTRIGALLLVGLAIGALVAAAASAATTTAHGQLLQPSFNSHQSTNWFGYNQGSLEQGGKQFNAITGDWTVPAATQHTRGQDEYSSDWIGIGGGCVDAGVHRDRQHAHPDRHRAGRRRRGQRVVLRVVGGHPRPVDRDHEHDRRRGDHMHSSIAEAIAGSNVWTITLQDVTRNETFTTTVPYSSTHLTAEWIEETPLLLGTNAGFAALPNLGNPAFTAATTNGANANLQASEEMLLTDSNGNVIGAPSAPNATRDGFSACTWATSC